MRKRDVVGKRIVDVKQEQESPCPGERPVWHVTEIVLEDGTVMVPQTIETEWGMYWTEMNVLKGGGDDGR